MGINSQQNMSIELLNPWFEGKYMDLGIKRSLYLDQISTLCRTNRQILFLFGSRRVGKTVIIFQYIYQLLSEGVPPRDILYLSLDNTNLHNLDLYTYLAESNFKYIFLDEIHYFPNRNQVLKSLYDLPLFKSKIICSGSSSKLIEDNKALLTGRSTYMNVYPLSFNEFREFHHSNNEVGDYLYYGGYPEYVLEKQPNYLNDLLRDIIEKDILKSHNVQNNRFLFDICQILAKQIGFRTSSNKIAKVLGIDSKTVINYIDYLKEVRLIDQVYQYSMSLNEMLYAPKKYYFSDLGMRNSFVGFSDVGSLVENAVFLKLSALYGTENIYYFSGGKSNEIDFVVTLGQDDILFVESKYNNLRESVVNSLSPQFFKDIYQKNIKERFVITDGIIDNKLSVGHTEVKLIPLLNFLEQGFVTK